MKVVFSGLVRLHYGQLYAVSSGCADVTIEEAFKGQSNGLCGAAVQGALLLMCGSHSATVDLAVTVHDAEPALEAGWEEVVEAPFRFLSDPPELQDWEGSRICQLPITGPGFMVRWAARNFGEADDRDPASQEDVAEAYSLSSWPSAEARERVLLVTSEKAEYWHQHARTL